ncbi:MAG: hypothetical protein KGY53_09480 [Wenzhouxiangellaceae bacterium]|nr:hypothetical protein [Wenzhouxiangellaceae bacterium]
MPALRMIFLLASGIWLITPASAAEFVENSLQSEPFGVFNDIEFVRHTGRFEGTTSLGEFSVPFEVVAPTDPADDTGTVLFEVPQWSFAPFGRELILGRELIFARGINYASVGFGVDGGNILDPTLPNPVIAGQPVVDPGRIRFSGPSDIEIIIKFVEAMRNAPNQVGLTGSIERLYAYGVSRSADTLIGIQQEVTGTIDAGLFDLTLLHNPAWAIQNPILPRSPIREELGLGGQFVPPTDVGNVMFVLAEGDQLNFASEVFRAVDGLPGQRIYEVAGAAHTPTVPQLAGTETGDNPVDHFAVMRGIFVAGDHWMRHGIAPPPSTLLDSAPDGQIDPVHGFETGIARDADGNALGGVRMPDLAIGQAQFIASDPTSGAPLGIPFLAPLTGSHIDLECIPVADDMAQLRKTRPGRHFGRFRNHGDYVSRFTRQAKRLVAEGFLLAADAEFLKTRAAESDVGKPRTCN